MSERHFISLGAGVQSSVLLLKAGRGEISPRPECAIFADTQWEPDAVYRHLEWLEEVSPIPVVRVTAGDLREDTLRHRLPRPGEMAERGFVSIPVYVRANGRSRMLRRQCTYQYKLRPLRRYIRDLLEPGEVAVVWLGITTDEAHRMKDPDVKYIRNRYPLIELGMSRQDCLRWCEENGMPRPPRSACIGCPFRRDAEWRELKQDPWAWADALAVDAAIRRLPRIEGEAYLHRTLTPLSEVDLSTPEEHGQGVLPFGEECEGMCGV